MQALVFDADRTAKIRQVPDPTPGDGEVLIRVEAAGICHTDHDILAGRYPAALPRVPGHEFAGRILDVGTGVSRLGADDRVAVDPLVSCTACRNCAAGRRNLCTNIQAYGADLDGGLAELVVVREQNCHPIADLPASTAALAEPLACATLGIQRINPATADRALIIGAGPIGLLLATALRGRGVESVSAADLDPGRLEYAQRFGVDHTYLSGPDLVEQIRNSSGDVANGFDIVIDATGRPAATQLATQLLGDNGTLLIFGVCPPGSQITLDPNEIYARQLTVLGSFSLCGTLSDAIQTLNTTSLPMADLVSHRYSLADAVDAFEQVGKPGTLKIQVASPP